MNPLILIRVEIPALEALVAYLTAAQQAQIDAMAARVADLTARLEQSTAALTAAETKE